MTLLRAGNRTEDIVRYHVDQLPGAYPEGIGINPTEGFVFQHMFHLPKNNRKRRPGLGRPASRRASQR